MYTGSLAPVNLSGAVFTHAHFYTIKLGTIPILCQQKDWLSGSEKVQKCANVI